jgi:hypothetical protein
VPWLLSRIAFGGEFLTGLSMSCAPGHVGRREPCRSTKDRNRIP